MVKPLLTLVRSFDLVEIQVLHLENEGNNIYLLEFCEDKFTSNGGHHTFILPISQL